MAKTKRTGTATPEKSPVVHDIEHEEVHESSLISTPAVLNPEEQIKQELQKFNLADAGIEALKKAYGQLVISGPDDKAGYKATREAWAEVRSKRTGLEKKGLEIRNQYKVITQAVAKEEDRLVALITPLEEDLYKKWKAIDEEKDRIKREQEEAEQRQLMARVEEVLALGMVFRDGFYQIGDTISMDVATLRSLPADQYEKLKTAISTKAAEIKEAARLAQEQKDREAAELKRQQDELKRQQDELKAQQDEMARQREELEKQRREAARLKVENRRNQLAALGFVLNSWTMEWDNGHSDISHKLELIETMEDEAWPAFIEATKTRIQEKNDAKSKYLAEKEKEAKEKERQRLDAERLEREKKAAEDRKRAFIGAAFVGVSFSYTGQSFTFENPSGALEITMDELLQLSDEEINDRAREFKKQIEELKELQDAKDREAKEAAEKQRVAGLKDAERWLEIMVEIRDLAGRINPDDFKTKEFKHKAAHLRENFEQMVAVKK